MPYADYAQLLKTLCLYPDERVAALLAHAQDGKLVYGSCCCLVGAINAPHALQGAITGRHRWSDLFHVVRARRIPGAIDAEQAFLSLAEYDNIRRRILIPVIKTEIRMRDRRRKLNEFSSPKWRQGQSVRVISGLAATERNREKAEQKETAHRQAIEHSWRRLKTSMASALVFFGKQLVFRAGYHPARETSRGPSIIRTT